MLLGDDNRTGWEEANRERGCKKRKLRYAAGEVGQAQTGKSLGLAIKV